MAFTHSVSRNASSKVLCHALRGQLTIAVPVDVVRSPPNSRSFQGRDIISSTSSKNNPKVFQNKE